MRAGMRGGGVSGGGGGGVEATEEDGDGVEGSGVEQLLEPVAKLAG
jgi:hypothetical protein